MSIYNIRTLNNKLLNMQNYKKNVFVFVLTGRYGSTLSNLPVMSVAGAPC